VTEPSNKEQAPWREGKCPRIKKEVKIKSTFEVPEL